ncbi:MAG: TIGR02281 family clan AA aspartic protease [Mariprofundaceae bacterium]
MAPLPVNAGSISVVGNPSYNLEKQNREVPYNKAGNSMVVRGEVNGVRVPFIVDTGASFVVISPAIARRAGLNTKNTPRMTIQTANGAVQAPFVTLSQVKIGGLMQRNVAAVVQQISPDGQTGLLGMSYLSAYKMTVDQNRSMLLLEKR